MNIFIVNYNTQDLTDCCIRSINNYNKFNIIVFDNSDKEKYINRFDNVKVIDNTKQQILNFNINKYKNNYSTSNFGSVKHSMSIDWFINNTNEDFILIDSDCIIKRNLSDIVDKNYVCSGVIEIKNTSKRILPYLLYINTSVFKQYNLKFFDGINNIEINKNCNLDTGGIVLLNIEKFNLKIKKVNINEYVNHLGNGSFHRTSKEIDNYIKDNKMFLGVKNIIPKVIHTFWLSNTDISNEVKDNIETWKSCNPDYEIKIHRISEFKDLLISSKYFQYTIVTKQWAYATDFLRSKILYEEGGWYMDGDVTCIKPLDELIERYDLNRYLSYEAVTPNIECAIIGTKPKDKLIKLLYEHYENYSSTQMILMPVVLKNIIDNNKLNVGYILDKEILSGIKDRDTRKIISTEKSYTIHNFTHTGYNFKLKRKKK